jgi:mono/diheme cytochrome c family protein
MSACGVRERVRAAGPFTRRAFVVAYVLCALGAAPGALAVGATAVPDTLAQRLAACTPCHGKEGRSIGGTYFPRIAGKPAAYLYNQLLDFREGRRRDPTMGWLVRHLPDAYLQEIARHFAEQRPPHPPATRLDVTADVLERGRRLVASGDPARQVPACTECHGSALTGMAPAVPGLLGLPRDYLNAQLGAWKNGLRSTRAPDCMAQIAQQLSAQDISAATAWLATRPVPADDTPAPMPAKGLAMRCASVEAATKPPSAAAPPPAVAAAGPAAARGTSQVERGRVLALAGNCAGCHTARGGAPYSGGHAIATPFGVLYGPNITPDVETGIGRWSADDFWRALHDGRSRDGSPLYPAFPYTSYTRVGREDSDALFAYLRSIAPVRQASRSHALRFPYDQRWLLSIWRALWFRPGEFRPDPARPADWNRGAYLVQGLGHCSACHTERNALGASRSGSELAGGHLDAWGWYSPALTSNGEAGVGHWPVARIVALLGTGVAPDAVASGPMAAVVYQSLQHLPDADLRAIAVYLKSLAPALAPPAPPRGTASERPASGERALGAKLYEQHCESCHRPGGEGAAPAYPALAGNRAVTLAEPGNAIRAVLLGGFAPGTAGNPRPYGMPPFGHTLGDAEIAAVVSYIRGAWGNRAPRVSPTEVNRLRSSTP